ncbi:ATP-binding protein [Phenylobacterium sp.]|uniref:ATP-binding protein n=1 Tax=Phenylobacterium sp. TaxID=1871053 RepID=UPI0025FDC5DA|nr:ATP-binding protein [Phenylobacterium sp.]
MTHEVEQLREALASTRRLQAAESQRLREHVLVINGIRALSVDDDPDILLARMFELLSAALAFDEAYVLEVKDDLFVCVASTAPGALGATWPAGAFFRRVAGGGAALVPDNSRVPEWASCQGVAPLPGGAIYAPIAAVHGPGLLVLCAHQLGAYSSADLALVSKLGLLVSQTLATGQRRRLAEAMHRAQVERQAAVDANETKSQFFANMSHEVRTPLNGVITVADLLARTDLGPRQREMVSLILESGRTLERLLSDILDFTKIEAGKLTLETRAFNLTENLACVCDLFAAEADAKGLRFDVRHLDAAQAWLDGDSVRVRQVVTNLLSNAVKFTEQGGVTLEVDVQPGGDLSTVVIRVRDTGCGFAAEAADRLFDRFEQADGSITRRFGGSGLGLAISRSLALQMGGDITCRSTPGEGSEFEFRFVAAPVQPAASAPEAEEPGAQRAWRILVAEDNPNNRRIIGMVLELIGADVTYAEDGLEACQAFAREPFDLILMDMQMPVLDGLSATRNIRALELQRGDAPIPIIVLSANAMTHQVAQSLEAGADAHMPKPIDAAALLAKISQLSTASLAPAAGPAAFGLG